MFHPRSSSLPRLLSALVAFAIVAVMVLTGPAPSAHADDREEWLFRTDFNGAPVGTLSAPLTVEQGTVTPTGTVAVADLGGSRALTVDGTAGQSTALLQWLNFPGALPISTTAELTLRVEAEFTTPISGTTGASFGLLAGATTYELVAFGPNGTLTRAGNTLGLTYTPGTKVKLDARINVAKQKVRLNLVTALGRKTFDLALDGAFTAATLNQLQFQAPADSGVTAIDNVRVRLNTEDDDDSGPPAVIVIGDNDIDEEYELVNGVVFVSIKIRIVNTGGAARGAFLVLNMDDFDELFDLADVTFLDGIGYVQRVEGKLVYIGLGQNNILSDKVQVKIKFKAKQNRLDVKINAKFRLNLSDGQGDRDIAVPPVVVAIPPTIIAQPVVVVQPLPVSQIDVRFKGRWDNDGLAIFGLPLTAPITQTNGLVVQYFERARLEYHPELAGTPYVVLIGLLGVELGYTQPATDTTVPTSTAELAWYFPATGHVLGAEFRSYWRTRGGLALFGLPISGVVVENGRRVQYFERARLEFHPENAGTPYEVELGRLGAELLEKQR